MQAVSDNYKNRWANPKARKADFKIELKRRYWSGSAYVLESSAREIPKTEIDNISPIQWKLDTQEQNKILASNVTIELKNDKWRWLDGNNTDGVFKPDLTITGGYDPYRSQFQIFYGYLLADGTYEYATVFTGEATNYIFDTKTGKVSVQITGREIKLQTADAQLVQNLFADTSTTPATGDGTNDEFLTDFSVWAVTKVRVAAVEQDQGDAGYKLSDVNEAELKAKITLGTPPTSGQAVDFSGRQWKRDGQVSTLVALLCDEAGIGSGDRDIEEPEFPGTSQFQEIKDQSEFAAGTLVDTEADSRPGWLTYGDVVRGRRFETQADLDDNYIKIPGSGTISIVAGGIEGLNQLQLFISSFSTHYAEMRLVPIGGGTTLYVNVPIGVAATYSLTAGTEGPYRLEFVLLTSPGSPTTSVRVISNTFSIPSNSKVSAYMSLGSAFIIPGNPFPFWFSIDNVRSFPSTPGTATFKLDLLAAPTAWGKLERTEVLHSGTATYKTAGSDDDITYEALVAVAGDGTIQSSLKRYLKIEGTYDANAGRTDGPEVDNLQVNFVSATLFVGHADFKAKDCFAAVQRLAEISGSEFGFNGAGRFFFRPKAVTPTSILTLDQSNAIEKLSTFKFGYDQIVNVAQVTYGQYYAEIDSTTEGEASPTSIERFGKRIAAKTISDFLFSNNANLAEGIAKGLYNRGYLPKRRFKVNARIIPHLELSDVITISFYDSPLLEDAILGDPLQKFPSFGESGNVVAREILCKVIGISYDIIGGKSTLDVEEVLTT